MDKSEKNMRQVLTLILKEAKKQVEMQAELEERYGIKFDNDYRNNVPDLVGLLVDIAGICAGGNYTAEEIVTDCIFDYLFQDTKTLDGVAIGMTKYLVEGE